MPAPKRAALCAAPFTALLGAILSGALLALAGCADLQILPANECGNGVLEPGEACDGEADCGAPGAEHACQILCSSGACREGYACGLDGVCQAPSVTFESRSATLRGSTQRHYTRDEIAPLSAPADLDIVLTHDAPAGVRFARHRRGEGFVSEAAGLDELLAKTRPRVCCFGHHHTRLDAEVAGVRCLGLNKGHYPGCLLAFEMRAGEREWRILGEWPAPSIGA